MLSRPFDEYLGFDQTQAITPPQTEEPEGLPETCPFGP
jgi:hypothetical protein